MFNDVGRSGHVAFVTDGGVWGVSGKVLAGANRSTGAKLFPLLLERNADCVASYPVLRAERTATDQLSAFCFASYIINVNTFMVLEM